MERLLRGQKRDLPLLVSSPIKVVRSSGFLRRHGPHDNPCTGHNLLPVPGSFVPATSGTTTTRASQVPADDTSADLFGHIVSPDPVSWPPYPWSPHPPNDTCEGCPPQCIYGPPTSPPDRGAGSPDFGSLGEAVQLRASMLWRDPAEGVRAAI